MEYTDKQRDGFFEAVESLKKYRRADLIDPNGRSLLKELYTDLLPNEHILKKSLKENTTFLIGRKGTGKSTIFLRIEQELREKKEYLPCYLDVKTIYESSQAKLARVKEVENILSPDIIEKYLIERAFIQTILSKIIEEISKKFHSLFDKLLEAIGFTKVESIKNTLSDLKSNIEDNEHLEQIEIPILRSLSRNQKNIRESLEDKGVQNTGFEANTSIGKDGLSGGFKSGKTSDLRTTLKANTESEDSFSSVFLQVFQIKDTINGIKEALSVLKIRYLYVLLDDFSEIDDKSIKTFVDVILAPLNNWSEEFIKFKIAAYPNRIYYGKIDPGKIDTINLDFYNLYSEFGRDKMETNAITFTNRILTKRINKFTGHDPEFFFDTTSNSIEDYFEILFNASMNVPRILGYILSYCYQSRILYNRPLAKVVVRHNVYY